MDELKLDREQIVKALECCTSADKNADCPLGCPWGDINACEENLMYSALALIRELTEENERLKAENVALENGLEISLHQQKQIEADTVRKMQERLKKKSEIVYGDRAVCVELIDQIAKELIQEQGE